MKNSLAFSTMAIVVLFAITSCDSSRFDSALLQGNWEVSQWKIETSGQEVNQIMDMTFGESRKYEIDYGGLTEEGKFWISGEFLHTVETGKSEKRVKLLKLDDRNLQFQMNRGGQLEQVFLIKRKE